MSSSIGTLEQQIKSYHENGHQLIRNLPPEFAALFAEAIAPGVNILKAWCAINMADVEAILTQVRSRLLDLCLELKDALGEETPPEQIVQKAATVDTTKIHTMIYGQTVIVGSTNIQVNNQKNDIDGLITAVERLGYNHEQLEELRSAVLADKAKGTTPAINEGHTGGWFKKAIGEAGKGVVKAGTDVVAGVIVKALQHYTGG